MAPKQLEGLIANLQDYSVHDGSGLRSVLFLKGCPLRCKWCQNPECLEYGIEIMFIESLCSGCFKCSEVCPAGAIRKEGYRIDREKCTKCGACVDACRSNAMKKVGFTLTAEEAADLIERYKVFYKNSDNGGVTISGGDPVFQSDFALEVLKACRARGIHTAIETSAYAPENVFLKLASNVDLLLADIKHMDPEKHKKGTGVSNEPILRNFRSWSKMENRPPCVVRIPLIPGFNDDEENVTKTCEFLKEVGVDHVDLLPFNFLADSKYRELGIAWTYSGTESQDKEHLAKLTAIVDSFGFRNTVGGLW